MKLCRKFYRQDAVSLAKSLLGKHLVREFDGVKLIAKIVETEAYMGPSDRASHAYNNRRTNRTETMFRHGGCSYIYLIYGMYNCLNVVCSDKGIPEAVLIRAVEPIMGIEHMKEFRNIKSKKPEDLTNGPGKLCQAMHIDRGLDGYDLVKGSELYIIDPEESVVNSSEKTECIKSENKQLNIVAAKRIGIDYAGEYKEKLWRFYIGGNEFVSKYT